MVNDSQCHMQPAEPWGFPRWVTFMESAAAEALEKRSELRESSRAAEGQHVTEPSAHSNKMPSLYVQECNLQSDYPVSLSCCETPGSVTVESKAPSEFGLWGDFDTSWSPAQAGSLLVSYLCCCPKLSQQCSASPALPSFVNIQK